MLKEMRSGFQLEDNKKLMKSKLNGEKSMII